ncbi:MAG: GTP 3',8-cyclase MoaA [Bdellovibrionales bacterium]|nr:GTP 3',8-cyclase MoaA [Bdellovibrionales bacterium]
MLADSFNRRFSYLRLSLTSLCNFRCQYCLPNGNVFLAGCKSPLTQDEIVNLLVAFAELGIVKVRLTGGEPALRSDLIDLIRTVSQIDGIKKTALTTNGFRLKRDVFDYRQAGLNCINLSVDSLNRKRFAQITGQDRFCELMDGLEKALALDWEVKINTVLLKGINDDELEAFLDFAKSNSVGLRFIELMPTKDNPRFFAEHHFDLRGLRNRLLANGWTARANTADSGPAENFVHSNFRGTVGLIRPYSTDFCGSCNRLRVSSVGELKLCLFGEKNYSLRSLLQAPSQKEELQETICRMLRLKAPAHQLHEGIYETRNFATIGG